MRPYLQAVLAPGQTYAAHGAVVRFAGVDKATTSAKLTFCAAAPPRVVTSRPAPLPNGTYPVLTLRGACLGIMGS